MHFVDISLLLISSTLGFFLAIFIARKRHAPGSQALCVLILGASIWSLCYAFEINAVSLNAKLFWEKLEYIGIVIIPLAWFTFVAQYLGYPRWMKSILRHRYLLAIIPIATLILVWTNGFHNLVWKQIELGSVGSLITLEYVAGPWFWIVMIFSYALLLSGSITLAMRLFGIVRLQRWQIVLALIAILLPWVGNILYLTGSSPERYLDWTAFLFLISGLLLTISLFRFQLVNILPIAQKAVLAGLADCVVVLDLHNNIVDINPSAKRMIGPVTNEPLGKQIAQVLPAIMSYINQAGYSADYKTEYTQSEGTNQQIYDLHITLLTDPSGERVGRLVVLHEITQLKHDHAELERARDHLEVLVSERTVELHEAVDRLKNELVQRTLAEKRFEDVIESGPDAMVIVDQSGSILLINAMAERLFGYPRRELAGKSIIEYLIPEEDRLKQRESFSQFLNNPSMIQSSFGIDLYAKRKDGSKFPMEVDLSRLDTHDGFWTAINIHDISERKKAETALRESEQTYRALFENAGDAIFLVGLNGDIQKVNQKAAELLGYDQKELEGLTIFDITLSDEHVDIKQKMQHLLEGLILLPYTRRYRKRNGDLFQTENNTVLVMDAQGNPKYFQNICRDITERITAEQAQRHLMEEIRQTNEQMRDLALRLQEVQELERRELATELHDRVGQNLTGLNLNLKILQNQLEPQFDPEMRQRLENSLVMVEETTHKIRNVMADLNPPILDEYGLSAAIKWFCDDYTRKTGIATHVTGGKLEPRLPPSVEKILFRLFQESLTNIAKHAQATQVWIGIKSTREAVSMTVKDNGLGFALEAIKNPTAQPHWGLLSMEQRAASIGAILDIDSAPGMGTRVCVKVRRNQNGN